jgi:hypothetical protein
MNSNYFHSESLSATSTIHWWGQIEDDVHWKGNETRKKFDNATQITGYGYRYRVRILGRDPSDKIVPTNYLQMAEVILPVTSGSGHASSFQTPNLRKGMFVLGIYRDGIDMSEPVILGVLNNNGQTVLQSKVPSKGFVPFSGYIGEGAACYAVPTSQGKPVEGSEVARNTSADKNAHDDGKDKTPIDSPSRCGASQLSGIQLKIQKLIKDIERGQKKLDSWESAIMKPINFKGEQMSVQDYVSMKVANASKDIAVFIKTIIDSVRKFTITKVNDTLKDFYYLIFPNQRPVVKKAQNKALELLSCLFNKIISNLLQMIGKFLLQCIDRFINTPLCAIENFVGGLLGKLGGLIGGFVDAILGPLSSIIGSAFSFAGAILGFIKQLLGFFSCEETPACAQTKEWSIWDGAGTNIGGLDLNLSGVFDAAANIGASVAKVSDPNNFDFNLDFSDVFKDTCNVGPVLCGPPIVSFYGGGGSGASGNAIISAAGDILGVNMITPGSGYSKAPMVTFYDSCGNGNGASGTATIGTGGGVTGVVINDPGYGYLPGEDGSLGGDGRKWADPGDTIIKHDDGRYDSPYKPGDILPEIQPGDTVTKVGINTSNPNQPGLGNGSYPAVLQICRLKVINPGLNYSKNDTIIVNPSNGIQTKPVFGPNGTIDQVIVTNCGIGYTEIPSITVDTETGYNVQIIPDFDVIRIGDIPEDQDTIPDQTQIIHIVDCVGRV